MTDERKPETPGLEEVSPKFVDEAEAATAAPPPSVSVPDAPLVTLGHQWKEVYGKWAEAGVYPDTSDRGAIRKYEKERTVLLLAINQLEDQATEIPVQSLDGVLVKLRMAGTHYHLIERDGEEWDNKYAKLTWQAWDGLERLVGGKTPTDEALSTLWQECRRLRQQYDQAIEETDLAFTAKQAITETETPEYRVAATAHEAAAQRQQETSDASVANENRMAKVPAHTVMGTLLKLRVAGAEIAGEFTGCDGVLDETLLGSMERLTLSALADLERLARQRIVTMPEIEDPVITLKREWEARYKALDEQRDDPNADDSDEAVQPFYDRLHETEVQILRTQATTPAGVAIKLILWARLHCNADEVAGLSLTHKSIKDHPHDLDRLPVMSALLDLEHMAQGTVPTRPEADEDATVRMAHRLWRLRQDVAKRKPTDEERDQTEGRAEEALDGFLATPALTPKDVVLKLKAYAEFMGNDRREQIVNAALRDLEDMAADAATSPHHSPLYSRVADTETPITDAEGAVEALWLLVEDGKLCPAGAEPIAYLVSHLNGHIQEQRRLFNELFVAAGGSAG